MIGEGNDGDGPGADGDGLGAGVGAEADIVTSPYSYRNWVALEIVVLIRSDQAVTTMAPPSITGI